MRSAEELGMVNVFLTMHCNLSCSFCASGSKPDRSEEIDFALLEAVAHETREWPTAPVVRFTGGEPTLYSRFRDAVELFDFAEQINITTNGTRLNPELLLWLAARKVSLNLSVYADLPGHAIRAAGRLREVIGSGVPTLCTVVAHRDNLPVLGRICDELKSWGATSIVLNGVNPSRQTGQPDAGQTGVLTHEEIRQLRAFVRASKQDSSCAFFFKEPPSARRRIPLDSTVPACSCGDGHISVLTDGTLAPCNSLISLGAGRLHDMTLTEGYRTPAMQFVRALRGLQPEQLLPCRECADQTECRVGSRVHAFLRTGDWLAVDPGAACVGRVSRLSFASPQLAALHRAAVASVEMPADDLVTLRAR